MVYNPKIDRTILYGGTRGSTETWAYDYNTNTWTKLEPATNPGGLEEHSLVYSSTADRVILFGGTGDFLNSTVKPSGETWLYDFNTNTWTNVTPKPKDTLTLVKEYYDAQNGKDIEKVMGYLSDDAIILIDPSGVYTNSKEENRRLFQGNMDGGIKYICSNWSEKDGEVRASCKITNGTDTIYEYTDGLTIVKDGKVIFDGLERFNIYPMLCKKFGGEYCSK